MLDYLAYYALLFIHAIFNSCNSAFIMCIFLKRLQTRFLMYFSLPKATAFLMTSFLSIITRAKGQCYHCTLSFASEYLKSNFKPN